MSLAAVLLVVTKRLSKKSAPVPYAHCNPVIPPATAKTPAVPFDACFPTRHPAAADLMRDAAPIEDKWRAWNHALARA